MFANILTVAAKALLFKANSQESYSKLIKDADISPDRFSFSHDKALLDGDFIVEANNILLKAKSAEELRSIVSITDSFEEIPSEMDQIVKTLSTIKEDVIRDLKSGAYNFMVFFTNDSKNFMSLKGLESLPSFKFFFSSDESLAKKFGASFPSILAYNATDKNLMNFPFTESFASIASAASLSYFSKVNQETFKHLQSLEQPIFYIIDSASNFNKNRAEFGSLMKPMANKAKFVHFSPSEIPALVELIDLKDTDFPVIINLNKDSKFAVKNVTRDNFTSSVEDILNKKAVPIKFSSKIPADNDSRAVKIVNTDSIPSVISDVSADRLVVFTSPRCGYCSSLKPILEQFSTLLKEKGVNLFVGDYNVIENEEVIGYDAPGVPSLFFIKKGSTSHTKLPSEVRSLKALLEYISREGVSSKINLADYAEHLAEGDNDDSGYESQDEEIRQEEIKQEIEQVKSREEL